MIDLEARLEQSRRERTTTTSDGGIVVESSVLLLAEWKRTYRIEGVAPPDGEAESEPPPTCLH